MGNHQTLTDFLLPDWDASARPRRASWPWPPPSMARFVLVTGVVPACQRPAPTSSSTTCWPRRRARSPARSSSASTTAFVGAGDTLSAALALASASGAELHAGVGEALTFLDQSSTRASAPAWAMSCPTASSGPCRPPRKAKAAMAKPADDAASPDDANNRRPRGLAMSTDPPTPVRRAQRVHPRRRQFAGARLPRRRRHAALHRPRAGRLHVGRRGPALHRLHRLLGPDDPRPRPPGGAGGGAEGRHRRASRSARPPSARSSWPRRSSSLVPSMDRCAWSAPAPKPAMSAIRLARGATGRSKHHQVRRLLPRPCRRAAGQGRLGPGHLRQPDQRRRARRGGAAHHGARVQQPRAARGAAFALHGADIACVMIEPIAGNMNFVRASVPFRPTARAVHASTARCWCSTR